MESVILSRLHQQLKRAPEQPCLVLGETRVSYREFVDTSLAWSGSLREKFRAGDRIGLWFGRDASFWFALLACWYAELVPVVLNPYMPRASNLELLAGLDLAGLYAAADQQPPWHGPLQVCGDFRDKVPAGSLPSARAGETAAILMTSGTTGISKGVVLSHAALGGNSLAIAKRLDLGPHDRWMFTTPPYFTSAICHVLSCIQTGAAAVAIHEGFLFPTQLLDTINHLQVTGYGGSPLQVRWLLDVIESSASAPTLKKLMTSGDALPPHVSRSCLEKLPDAKLHIVYGLTELGGRFCSLDPAQVGRIPDSVGKPIDGLQAFIMKEDGTRAAPLEEGEVYAHGDYLMDGYLNRPEITAETLTEHGLKTGDLGCMDEEGNLFLKGRLDDVFKSSGEKVSRVLIEQALISLGLFTDVAVLPVPDEFLGLTPKVYYVCAFGKTFDRAVVVRALTEKLPESHLPNQFQAVSEIPRTGSGKLLKKELERLEEDENHD